MVTYSVEMLTSNMWSPITSERQQVRQLFFQLLDDRRDGLRRVQDARHALPLALQDLTVDHEEFLSSSYRVEEQEYK